MYPTATMYPGPANASALRQNETPFGTWTVWYDSGRLGSVRGYRHAPRRPTGVVEAALMEEPLWNTAGHAPARGRLHDAPDLPEWSLGHRMAAGLPLRLGLPA